MNDKGNENREGLFIPMNERALVTLMGLLLSGLAHGAPEKGVAVECIIQNGNGATSQQELKCTPLHNTTKDMTNKNSGQNQNPPHEEESDTHTSRLPNQNASGVDSSAAQETIDVPGRMPTGNETHFDNNGDRSDNIESINSSATPDAANDKTTTKADDMSDSVSTHDNLETGTTITNDSTSSADSGKFSSEDKNGKASVSGVTSPYNSENSSVKNDKSKSGNATTDVETPDNNRKDGAASSDTNSTDHGNGAAVNDSNDDNTSDEPNTNDSSDAAANDDKITNKIENDSAVSPDAASGAVSGGVTTTNDSKGADNSSKGLSTGNERSDSTAGEVDTPDTTSKDGMSPDDLSTESTTTPDKQGSGTSDSQAGVTGDPKQLATDGSVTHSPTIKPQAEIFNIDKTAALEKENESSDTSNRDLFSIGGESNKTSDHYQARTYSLSYRNRRREWFWPWQESEDKDGLDWGLDIYHTKGNLGAIDLKALNVEATLGGYLSEDTYLQARIGHHELNTDSGDRTITPHQVKVMFGLDNDFSVQLENNRDFIYTGGSVTGGITKQLAATNNLGSFRWHPDKRIKIEGQAGYSEYDQDNEERQGNISALYGISPDWPWIWAGLGVEALNFHRNVTDYWSPNRFYAYGLRLESSFPINDRLTGSLSSSLNRQQERQLYNGTYTYGNGYELSAGLQYRLYGQIYARFDMSKSKSLQNGTSWRANNIFFSLNMPLF